MTGAEGPAAPIRVLLVDDHTLFREGVASLLERAADLALVGQAATGEAAVRLAGESLPDIVLMDLKMPGMGGIEATRALLERAPHVGIIVLTMFEDDDTVIAALRAGARGYVLKDADRGTLLRAIRAVARGEVLLGPEIARRVFDHLTEPANVSAAAAVAAWPEGVDRLTPREVEVVRLITQGLRNREIADRLSISERTVGNHISNIFAKLRVRDRAEAIIHARRLGLGPPDEDRPAGVPPGWRPRER
jgi:DNA-binding NarL/FixJ family response regulator